MVSKPGSPSLGKFIIVLKLEAHQRVCGNHLSVRHEGVVPSTRQYLKKEDAYNGICALKKIIHIELNNQQVFKVFMSVWVRIPFFWDMTQENKVLEK
jgi:hypothetical protein